jgi:hypothetical protein
VVFVRGAPRAQGTLGMCVRVRRLTFLRDSYSTTRKTKSCLMFQLNAGDRSARVRGVVWWCERHAHTGAIARSLHASARKGHKAQSHRTTHLLSGRI